MDWITLDRWSPYAVGAGIGLLGCLAFLLSDKAIGCSTAFSRTCGLLEKAVAPKVAAARAYYAKHPPLVDWEWMLGLGIPVGALLAVWGSGGWSPAWVPDVWAARFGADPLLRLAGALLGGMLIGLGSRWAGGCTSGHGISGMQQLAASSWLATACFFAGGVAAAYLLFRVF